MSQLSPKSYYQQKSISINFQNYLNFKRKIGNKPFFRRFHNHSHETSSIKLDQENDRYQKHLKFLRYGDQNQQYLTLSSMDQKVTRSLQQRQIPYMDNMVSKIQQNISEMLKKKKKKKRIVNSSEQSKVYLQQKYQTLEQQKNEFYIDQMECNLYFQERKEKRRLNSSKKYQLKQLEYKSIKDRYRDKNLSDSKFFNCE